MSAVADLRAPELLEDVRQAYADDLVDLSFARLEDIERDLNRPARPLRGHHVITDAIAAMQGWHRFHREESASRKLSSPAWAVPATAPIRRVKVGRNEPCPCGSGRKYKRCCGAN